MADTSSTRIATIAESTYGVTPTTPAFDNIRFTGDSLKHVRQNTSSNEIRPDRNVADLVQVSGGAEGGVNFELSYGTFEAWLTSFMFNNWDDDVLVNGRTQKSFTIEKTYDNLAADQYLRFVGMIANTFSLNIAAQSIVTGSFGFMGKGGSIAETAISGATYADPTDTPVMSAVADFANLTIAGVSSPKITSLTLEGTNNLRQRPVVGSLDSLGVGAGRFDLKGSITMYFDNKSAYEVFLNGGEASLSFKIGGALDKHYIITVPRLKFSDGDLPTPGNDQDVFLTLPFQGLYDSTDDCALMIERVPA